MSKGVSVRVRPEVPIVCLCVEPGFIYLDFPGFFVGKTVYSNMNYIASSLANRRIKEQNDKISSFSNGLDNAINAWEKLSNSLDNLLYSGRKFNKRSFTHKITGYTYEISHFDSFERTRKEIISDTRNWFINWSFVIIIPCLILLFTCIIL